MKTFLIDMHYIIILKKEMLCNMRPMYVYMKSLLVIDPDIIILKCAVVLFVQ